MVMLERGWLETGVLIAGDVYLGMYVMHCRRVYVLQLSCIVM